MNSTSPPPYLPLTQQELPSDIDKMNNFLNCREEGGEENTSAIESHLLSNYISSREDIDIIKEKTIINLGFFINLECFAITPLYKDNSKPLADEELNALITRSKKAYQHEVVKDVTDLLNMLGYPNCAERIEFLHNYDDFEEGEHPLSLESTKSFLSFLRDSDFFCEINKLGAPLIGLFPEGTLSAEWKTSDNNKHLLIEFHPDDIISFAMIEDDTVHIDGHGPYKTIIDTLRKQGVTNWGI